MTTLSLLYLAIGIGSALVSGMTGLAGGVLLLSALTSVLPISAVIPLHALIQVLANLSRVLMLRANIDWTIWRSFNLLTIPAGLVGAYYLSDLPREALQASVGFVVVFAALYTLKKTLSTKTQHSVTTQQASSNRRVHVKIAGKRRYIALGFTSSLLGMVIGATGPLIAPFFMIDGLKRERFIATKSACQLTVQIIKTAIFFQLLNFNYLDYKREVTLIVIGVIGGTYIAKRALRRVNGIWLELLISVILVSLGVKLIWRGFLGA